MFTDVRCTIGILLFFALAVVYFDMMNLPRWFFLVVSPSLFIRVRLGCVANRIRPSVSFCLSTGRFARLVQALYEGL
jgi:hypothetical protein